MEWKTFLSETFVVSVDTEMSSFDGVGDEIGDE